MMRLLYFQSFKNLLFTLRFLMIYFVSLVDWCDDGGINGVAVLVVVDLVDDDGGGGVSSTFGLVLETNFVLCVWANFIHTFPCRSGHIIKRFTGLRNNFVCTFGHCIGNSFDLWQLKKYRERTCVSNDGSHFVETANISRFVIFKCHVAWMNVVCVNVLLSQYIHDLFTYLRINHWYNPFQSLTSFSSIRTYSRCN